MKFLIAGLGSIGRRHLRNLVAAGETDILLYRTGKSTLPDDELKGFPVETSLNSALAQRPDGVIVANPSSLHLDVAIPAAEAGCSILLEKPIAETMDRIPDLEKHISRNQNRVLVGFQFRFHPTIRKAESILKSRQLGTPLSFYFHWGEYLPGWHPWEDYRTSYAARKDLGGGVIYTLCHPLDYCRMLLGEVKSLNCFMGNLGLNLEVEDSADISLKMESGAIGTVHVDYNQQPGAHYFEIVCSDGTIKWNNSDGVLNVFHKMKESREDYYPPEAFERNHMFRDEIKHFIEMTSGNEKSLCTLEDGKKTLELTLAAYNSAREGMVSNL